MSRTIALIAILAPYLLMVTVTLECTAIKLKGGQCVDGAAMAETIQQVTTVAFAWLATPPR